MGFQLLFGYFNCRTELRLAIGIIILFGAPMIVRELMMLAGRSEAAVPGGLVNGGAPAQPEVPDDAPVSGPYAGAGMPLR
jgi:hypothetical protein